MESKSKETVIESNRAYGIENVGGGDPVLCGVPTDVAETGGGKYLERNCASWSDRLGFGP